MGDLNNKSPAIPVGKGKKFIPLVPTDEAIIYRNFIAGAGTRAIVVGYPEKLNLAFDANELRLAMIWKGGFIDAARHWTDRGEGFEGPLGDDVMKFPNGQAFAGLLMGNSPWPTGNPRENGFKFLGYNTTKDERPTFRYSYQGLTIEDFPNPSGKENPTLKRQFTLTGKPVEGVFFRAAVGDKIEEAADGWYKVDGFKVRVQGAKAEIRISNGEERTVVRESIDDGRRSSCII